MRHSHDPMSSIVSIEPAKPSSVCEHALVLDDGLGRDRSVDIPGSSWLYIDIEVKGGSHWSKHRESMVEDQA